MSIRDLSPASSSPIANLNKPASIEGYFMNHLFIFINYLLKYIEKIKLCSDRKKKWLHNNSITSFYLLITGLFTLIIRNLDS